MVWSVLAHASDVWASLYSNAPVLRTAVAFTHVGGLVVSGGWAITTDRSVLAAARADANTRRDRLHQLHASHRYVLVGLTVVMVSGLLLLAADRDTYLTSIVFWSKMGAIALLAANGAWLHHVGRVAETQPRAWRALSRAALFSMVLWGTALLGTALPNVGS